MFGFNRRNWGNYFGLRGLPGTFENIQQMMAQMNPQGGGYEGGMGNATNLSELFSQMRGQGDGGGQSGGGSYLGGNGFI